MFGCVDAWVGFAEASRNVSVSEDAGRVALVVEASGSLTQPIRVSYTTVGGVATGKVWLVFILHLTLMCC